MVDQRLECSIALRPSKMAQSCAPDGPWADFHLLSRRRSIIGMDNHDTGSAAATVRPSDPSPSCRVARGYIHTSAAFALPRAAITSWATSSAPPRVGDAVYGRVAVLGHHRDLENRSGRIHRMSEGTAGVFIYGNRYATDGFEALVPDEPLPVVDMVARSGVVAEVRTRSSKVAPPTQIEILGHLIDADGHRVNTRDFRIRPPKRADRSGARAKLILVVGTSMNAGKSTAAAAICWALTAMGHKVRGAKVTGTASLKEILHLEDAGATHRHDFTSLGWPSTYLLDEPELLEIFNTLDLRYANNPGNWWVVELADGLLQRETAMLLAHPTVRARIHRLVLCATDTLAALGGMGVLDEHFGLEPDAVSGLVASSPLGMRELHGETKIPAFDSAEPDVHSVTRYLIAGS